MEKKNVKPIVLGFKPCSSICVSGSTSSGKTYWIRKFLENIDSMYAENPPIEILYCYGVYQNLFDEMKQTVKTKLSFHEGLPTTEETMQFSHDKKHRIIVLDDLFLKAIENEDIVLLFTQYCHHHCISVIFVQQNLFSQGKHSRTIAMNTWYLVLFENVRDKMQVNYLGRQAYPGKSKNFMKAYYDAVQRPYGYLLLDFSHNVDEKFRMRTNVFPSEEMLAYQL